MIFVCKTKSSLHAMCLSRICLQSVASRIVLLSSCNFPITYAIFSQIFHKVGVILRYFVCQFGPLITIFILIVIVITTAINVIAIN